MAIRETFEPWAPSWVSTSVKRGPENRALPVQDVAVVISCAGSDASCSDSISAGFAMAPPDTAISAALAGTHRDTRAARSIGATGAIRAKRRGAANMAVGYPEWISIEVG